MNTATVVQVGCQWAVISQDGIVIYQTRGTVTPLGFVWACHVAAQFEIDRNQI